MGQPYGCPAVQFIERNVYRIPLIAPVIPNQRVMRSGIWILKEFWRTGLLCKKCLLSYVIEGSQTGQSALKLKAALADVTDALEEYAEMELLPN